jgi:hypothetical protein
MTTKTDSYVELSERDKQRMACLYEEVQGRLKEMSLIVARTLNQKVSERTHVMLRPITLKAKNSGSPHPGAGAVLREGHVEVHCTETSPHHFECGCYDYDAGTCGPC